MNAVYLHLPDGTATEWTMCSKCQSVASPGHLRASEKCCTCYHCGGALSEDECITRSLYHRDCDRQERAKREASALDNAVLVTDYDGPVYCEGAGTGSFGDCFFEDVDELSESLDNYVEPHGRPAFAYCCTATGFRLDLERILEDATEEFEDRAGVLFGQEDLQAAVDVFNKANEALKVYHPDYKRKVAIPLPPEHSHDPT